MTGKPAPVFLHRPQGVGAMPIGGGGSAAGPYKPVRAVLQTADGGVLVRSVVRQPDGTFAGEVYGIMPRERRVTRGERVRFEESQIFTFKSDDTVDAELVEMLQAFEQGLREIEAEPTKGRVAALPSARDVDVGLGAVIAPKLAQPAPAAVAPDAHRLPPRRPADEVAAEAGEELSVAEAMAILCPSEREGRDTKEATMQNDFAKHAPSEQAAPRPESRYEEPIACMECGAILPPLRAAANPAQTPPTTRIGCPRCGRINDIAEAKAADLSRQRTPSSG